MFMWNYLSPKAVPLAMTILDTCENGQPSAEAHPPNKDGEIFTGYLSDQTDDGSGNSDGDGNGDGDSNGNGDSNGGGVNSNDNEDGNGDGGGGDDGNHADDEGGFGYGGVSKTQEICPLGIVEQKRRSAAIKNSIPLPKRRKLKVPARVRRQGRKNELFFARIEALKKIEVLLSAKLCPLEGGHSGLQASRARAIRGYLHMLARNDRRRIDASERAAEAQGFAAEWGGAGWFVPGQSLGSIEGSSQLHGEGNMSRHSRCSRILISELNCGHMFVQTNGRSILQNLLILWHKRWSQWLQKHMGRTF